MNRSITGLAWYLWRVTRLEIGMCVLGLIVLRLFHMDSGEFNGYLLTLEVAGGVTAGLSMMSVLYKASLSEKTDLAAAGCGYPRQLMLLPVRTPVLALLPMIYGSVMLSGLWMVFAAIVGVGEGAWVTALGLSALVVTIQAIAWSTTSRPHVKTVLAIVWVITVAASAPTLLYKGMTPQGLGLVFGGYILFAAAVGLAGLAKGRSGSYSELPWPTLRRRSLDHAAPFASGQASQDWLENRRNGRFLPTVGVILAAGYLFPLLMFPELRPFGWTLLVSPLSMYLFPYLLCAWIGVFEGCCGSERDVLNPDRSIATFFGMRPLSDAALIASKLRMALRATAVTWLILLPGPILFLCSRVTDDGRDMSIAAALWHHMTLQFFVALVLSLGLVFFYTWRSSVSAMWLRLSRHVFVHGAVGVIVPISLITFFIGMVNRYSYRGDLVGELMPWITPVMLVAVVAKLIAAHFVVGRLRRHDLVSEPVIQRWATTLAVAGVVLLPLARIALPAWITTFQAAAGVVLVLPMVRVPMAVLTLHANRHRGTTPLAAEHGALHA